MDAPSRDNLSTSSRRHALWVRLLLTAILLLAAVLRWVNFSESLWLDELHTAWCVNGDFSEVAKRASQGNQPPLPYWLLWGWVQVAGISEVSLRGPALVCSLATVWLVFVLVRRWTGCASPALLAAFALAVEPQAIFYGGEARVYALVQLLAIVHVGLFIELLQGDGNNRKFAVAWVLVGAALFYVHYTAALLFVAEALALFLVGCAQHTNRLGMVCCAHPTKPTKQIRSFLLLFFFLALLCLPALGQLWQIAGRRANWAIFIEQPRLWDLWYAVPVGEAMAVAIVLLTALLLMSSSKKTWNEPQLTVGIVVWSWFLVPLGLAWLVAWFDVARLFHIRYYVVFLPAWACLLGWLVACVPERRQRWFVSAAVVVMLLWRSGVLEAPAGRQEDWRSAVAWLNERSTDESPPTILLGSGLIEADALRTNHDPSLEAYCSFPLRSAYPLLPGTKVIPLPCTSPGKVSPQHAELLQQGAWLVLRGDQASSEQCLADLQHALGDAAADFQPVAQFAGITLFRRIGISPS